MFVSLIEMSKLKAECVKLYHLGFRFLDRIYFRISFTKLSDVNKWGIYICIHNQISVNKCPDEKFHTLHHWIKTVKIQKSHFKHMMKPTRSLFRFLLQTG